MENDLSAFLHTSLVRQQELLNSSLVLNPVENFPFSEDLAASAGPIHGLYNSDKPRTREQRLGTPIQFAGRQDLESAARVIYSAWANALGAADATLRLLSGLHAHIVLFMSMARPGQKVMLLPVSAGGHLAGQAILERLGLEVIDMVVDEPGMSVDLAATLDRYDRERPDFVLVDRSEGLTFEDFAPLTAEVAADSVCVFDASQYLANVIAGDHPNPLNAGFDLLVASVHKNFPGPQKALLATRELDEQWQQIIDGVSTFVSNMHVGSVYAAGLALSRTEWLTEYSRKMLDLAVRLEDELAERGVPVVRRPPDRPPTHHLWICEPDRESAFTTYERLEQCLIMTNFRVLPYSLGYGLRLGTNAAARLGMTIDDVPRLAELIAQIRVTGPTAGLKAEVSSFNEDLRSKAVIA